MKPYYQDDFVTIYHGDCREILPQLDSLHFAALITDPPYGMAYKSNGGGTTKKDAVGWWFGEAVHGDEDTRLRDEILEWWGNAGPAFVFGTWKVERPASTRAVLIYDKGGATGMGDLSIPFKPSHEEIYVIGGPFAGTRDCGSVLQGRVQAMAKNGREHPTEKDPRTIRQLIAKTLPGAILDPCMGVGTTLRAAKDLGRPAVGIEIEERYCEAAARRCAQDVLGATA
jgi:DNA modification methylase